VTGYNVSASKEVLTTVSLHVLKNSACKKMSFGIKMKDAGISVMEGLIAMKEEGFTR
jgi:hypothetical protein